MVDLHAADTTLCFQAFPLALLGGLDPPATYAFLVVVFVMSYDLSGDIVRTAELSGRLKQKETELRTAVADERNRIAADLHDSVTQTLFSTSAIAEALPDVWERHPEEARQGLLELRQLTKGALAEMRSLLVEVRPAAIQEKSLGDLLSELAAATAGRSRIKVNVQMVENRELPNNVKVALYRVAQSGVQVASSSECAGVNFWSVTLYDVSNASGLKNEQPFPSVGSLDRLKYNDDGSIDLYFAPELPEGAFNRTGVGRFLARAGFPTSDSIRLKRRSWIGRGFCRISKSLSRESSTSNLVSMADSP